MKKSLSDQLSNVSTRPGVYLMKNTGGDILYIGKAGNLKKRLSSYFAVSKKRNTRFDSKTRSLLKKISSFDTIITSTENEALILEAGLIKRHQPKYNVILKDGKRYPSLRLDIKNNYPTLSIVRKISKDGSLYFGPYSSASSVRQTMKTINKTFMLRKCKTRDFKNRRRPCINFQMGYCLGPCCNDVSPDSYDDIVKEVTLFLKGKGQELLKKIKKEMLAASEVFEFEKASQLRDRMFAITRIMEKQAVASNDFIDRDVISYAGTDDNYVITMLNIRGGLLIGTRHFDAGERLFGEAGMISEFIRRYYEKTHFIPKEILVCEPIEDAELIEKWLGDMAGRKVTIKCPKRGEKARLVNMAFQNAKNEHQKRSTAAAAGSDLLKRLKKRLKMDRIPARIECFDNSNLAGQEPVSSMIVFHDGKPARSYYRKFILRNAVIPDDYAFMYEVLKRRFSKKRRSTPHPDLLIVDGGKGQLNIAVSVLKELGLEKKFEVIGIAKKDEKKAEEEDKVFKHGRVNRINFSREKDLLLFIQKIRDEAHRFAVSFHRKRRTKALLKSELDGIRGIGKKRKIALLKHFGSVKKIRAAALSELSAVPGMTITSAKALQTALKRKRRSN